MHLRLILHDALKFEYHLTSDIEGDVSSDFSLVEGLKVLLEPYPQLKSLLFPKGDVSPLFLFISDGVELKSTGKLFEVPRKDVVVIKLVPVFHGG